MACMWCGLLYVSFFILQVQNTGSAPTPKGNLCWSPRGLVCVPIMLSSYVICKLSLSVYGFLLMSQAIARLLWLNSSLLMLPQDGGLNILTELHTFVVKDCGSSTQEEKKYSIRAGSGFTSLLSRHLIEQNNGLYLVVCIFPLSIRIFLSDLSHNPLLFFSIVQGLLPMTR